MKPEHAVESIANEEKNIEEEEQKKQEKRFSVGGLIVAGILLVLALTPIVLALLRNQLGFETLLPSIPWLVVSVTMLIRAFCPPLAFGRGVATVLGGFFAGGAIIILLFANNIGGFLAFIVMLVLSILLLRVGFKR